MHTTIQPATIQPAMIQPDRVAKPGKSTLFLSVLRAFLIAFLLAAVALILLFSSISIAQNQLVIGAGETLGGKVSNRLGQEWAFRGCASDVITLTASSGDFVPFLALFDATAEDALIEAAGDEPSSVAQIAAFPLPRNDTYTILVAGSNVRDRGPYSLTVASSSTTATTGATTDATTDAETPQIFPGQRVTGEVTSRFGSEFVFLACATDVVTFSLESALFVPHLELFGPSGREPLVINSANRAGADAQINGFALPEAGLYTLVAAGEKIGDRGLFTLEMALAGGKPVTDRGTATPTPTLTFTPSPTPKPTVTPTIAPTPTSTPTPTPSPQASVLQPQGVIIQVNGGDGDLEGELFMNPSYMISTLEEDDTIVVGDRFYLELFVYDPQVGRTDGAGINRVEFEFNCPNEEQFRRIERTPRYCSFGGGEPDCNVLVLRSGEMFPGTNCEIVNNYYSVNITAYPNDRSREPGNWVFNIRPEIP